MPHPMAVAWFWCSTVVMVTLVLVLAMELAHYERLRADPRLHCTTPDYVWSVNYQACIPQNALVPAR